MATEAWLESASRPDRAKPVGAGFLAEDHALAGAGVTYGTDDAERAAAEMFVRRAFNRHDCKAAQRRAEDERMGWVRMRYRCPDPRHDDDVAAMAEALQWLGLRPTPRPVRRSDALTARPKQQQVRGRCRECGRRIGLRVDGTVRAHDGCPGEGLRPERGKE